MSIFGKLRGMVPPSSRSFHQMYADMNEFRQVVCERLDRMSSEMDSINQEWDKRIRTIDNSIEIHDSHMKLYAQQLYRRDGEESKDAQMRFFRTLPKATGVLRLQQLVCKQLLHDFDVFCSQNDLTYWMVSGTLLGAIRHEGFIPWDDDVDLGMSRADVEKLLQAAARSDVFTVSEKFDWNPRCRQVRFSYQDEFIPCFLDIFLFDFATIPYEEAFNSMQVDRKRIVKAMQDDAENDAFWKKEKYVTTETPEGERVAAFFNNAINAEYAPNGFLTDDPLKAQSIIWGLDNVDSFTGCKIAFPTNVIMPTKRMPFEELQLLAPNDPETVVDTIFGDYLTLPNDINSHFDHIEHDVLSDRRVLAAMNALVGKQPESDGA